MRTSQVTISRFDLFAANLLKKGRVHRGPTALTIETTTKCNLKCVTCHRTHFPDPPRLMSMDLFKKILDDCGDQVELVHLFGMGEPLLDPHLVERVRLCSERGILVHVATNATLLFPERSEALLDAGLGEITFSLSSARPERYEKLQPGANYGVTVRNIESFLAIKRKRKSPVHVTVEMIRTYPTASECDGVIDRWRKVTGVNSVRVRHDEFGTVPDLLDDDEHWAYRPGPCLYLWQGPLLIRADGGMYPCCVSALHGESMANDAESSPRDFWTSEAMTKLRKKNVEGIMDPRLPCVTCRAPKPIPVLGHLTFFASAGVARRIAVVVERLSLAYKWRLQKREII